MAKLSLKKAEVLGWLVALSVTGLHTVLAVHQILNQNQILGIVNIYKKTAYIYEGSPLWLLLNGLAVIIFYALFVNLIYTKLNNFKKIKPFMMVTAISAMIISAVLSSMLVTYS